MTDLDAELLAAHAAGNTPAFVDLYERAAAGAADPDASAFYLTHAYVFALEMGAPEAQALRHQLVKMGREASV